MEGFSFTMANIVKKEVLNLSAKLITYDLLAPGQDYKDLIRAIQQYDNVKITESCYVVNTTQEPIAIRDNLKRYLDSDDRLFVTNLKLGSAWTRIIGDGEKFKTMPKE